ncbi:MAG: hypothetical protein Q8L77_10495 [Nitrospirota bacterium]|nr:hypothetical protein [Nitrospirota bacterium]
MIGICHPSIRRLQHCIRDTLYAAVIVGTLLGPVHAEESPATPAMTSSPIAEAPVASEPATIDPSITLRGSVWRTKAGIVFLRTPIGLLSLSSKTTLKDLKASHEVRLWVHGRHTVVEIRKRADGSLVHRYLSGPMTAGTGDPKSFQWWGPDGDLTIQLGTEDERLSSYHEGDLLTVEVDDANSLRGVHDLQFDLQISQAPPTGADAQLLLSGTVTKLKSNFVFIRTPIGLVMLNSKIGVPHVKVGQPLTIRIDQEHVTVTLPSTKPATPRSGAATIR